MKLNYSRLNDRLLITPEGRLDATWADFFRNEVAAQIRAGELHLIVDASRLQFLSSAGIRALVQVYKEVKGVNGTWQIAQPTSFVRQTLETSGFAAWLIDAVPADFLGLSPLETPTAPAATDGPAANPPATDGPAANPPATDGPAANPPATDSPAANPPATDSPAANPPATHGPAASPSAGRVAVAAEEIESYTLAEEAILRFSIASAWRPWNVATLADVAHLEASPDLCALGIGSLAATPEDAAELFGEFVAVAGNVACQPADAQSPPDYLFGEREFIPSLQTIQALVLQGQMRHMIRFSAPPECAPFGLAVLLDQMLKQHHGAPTGWVMLAEIEGLVGSGLIRSPVSRDNAQPMAFPEVRDWISFCGERLYAGQQALVVGMVSRTPPSPIAPWLTPLASSPGLFAHAHAAVFPYQPLPRGNIAMAETTRRFFLGAPPLAVLHLLDDQRPLVGLGETVLRRGVCWFSPLEMGEVAS